MTTQLNLPYLSRENSYCDQSPIAGGIDEDLIPLFIELLSLETTEEHAELGQVARAYQETSKMMDALGVVDQFVRANPIRLAQSYDYHRFHHELTVITEQVKTRDDLKGIWKTFLNRLEGRMIYQPNGRTITLHTEMERNRLEGRNIKVITECFDPDSYRFDWDLRQMVEIAKECFVDLVLPPRDILRESLLLSISHVYLAKSENKEGEVLGYMWAKQEVEEKEGEEDKYLYISHVARKAEACSIGVANKLFEHLFDQALDRFSAVYLEVRESNRKAIDLYSKWGFGLLQVDRNSYTHPTEDAHLMLKPLADKHFFCKT